VDVFLQKYREGSDAGDDWAGLIVDSLLNVPVVLSLYRLTSRTSRLARRHREQRVRLWAVNSDPRWLRDGFSNEEGTL